MAEKINFEGLQPESLVGQDTWLDFMSALAETIQEEIRDPIGEIEDIRHIIEDTDAMVIVNTIKQLGFDLPADIIAHNTERLARSVYMLSLFHELSGTNDFVKGAEFVLGRELNVVDLYTNDYVDFYEKPFGPMLADGGDWYATTHIRLGMELIPNDTNLVLPENKTLADRLMDAFFEFAPVNLVVEEFYFIVKSQITLHLAGAVHVDPIDFLTIGLGIERVATVRALAPPVALAGTSVQLFADVVFESGCFALDAPVYGYSATNIDEDSEIGALPLSLPNTANAVVAFDVPAGQFGFVSYPKELGLATFINQSSSFEGGWDGAGWPEDGIGVSIGPITVTRTIDGTTRSWYVYRTDFSGLGTDSYSITFQNSGRTTSCELIEVPEPTPVPEPEPTPEPEPPTGPDCTTEQIALLPIVGVGPIGISDDAESSVLTAELANTGSGQFTVNAAGITEYGYFMYPIQLGPATIVDQSTGFEGGWDGASWPDSGAIGLTDGPIVISRTVGDDASDWYLYRTDFPGIGEFTFDFTLVNSGVSVEVTKTTCVGDPEPEPTPEPEPEPTPTGQCEMTGLPLYGSAVAVENDAQVAALSNESADTNNQVITVNAVGSEYGWFAHPAALGVATLVDQSTGFEGGWDGAGWDGDGSIGLTEGPALIERTISGATTLWYLYRTDFPGIGSYTYDVTFVNPNMTLGQTIACDNTGIAVAGDYWTGGVVVVPEPEPTPEPEPVPEPTVSYPIYGTWPVIIRTGQSLTQILTSTTGTNADTSITIDAGVGEHAYFAHPAFLGVATFTNNDSGFEGGWDGATWGIDGDVDGLSGPLAVYRTIDGLPQTWYLYRTDFPGIGEHTFNITYGTAVSDGTGESRVVRVILPEWSTNRPDIVHIDALGMMTFSPVLQDTLVSVTVTFDGTVHTTEILVEATGALLTALMIEGPTTIDGDTSELYAVKGLYSDNHIRDVYDAEVRVLNPFATFIGYELYADNPAQNQAMTIEAIKTNREGLEFVAAMDVELISIAEGLHVTDLEIVGVSVMGEGSVQQYLARATFSDLTSKNMLVLWETSTPALYIDQEGKATSGYPEDDFTATLTATLQYDGIKTVATKIIAVSRIRLTPTNLKIIGTDQVVELSSAKYAAHITWSNGVVNQVAAEWSTDKFSVSPDGLLTAGSVGDPVSINLVAKAQGLVDTKVVAIYDTPIEIDYITISGPENLREDEIGQYTAIIHYNDGRQFEVVPEWAIANSPAWASINPAGQLTFSNPVNPLLELVVTYDDTVRIHTQTKPVVLIPNVSLISGLVITGESEVLESKRVPLTATALYDDGSTEVVQPIWTVRSADPINEPEPSADIVSPGVIQGRAVDEDTIVVVVARYFSKVTEFPMIVKDYEAPGPDVPLSFRIVGPSVIDADEVGSYTLLCLFDNGCSQEVALSNDWALDVDTSVAAIDQNGFLQSVDGNTATVQVLATWEYAGHSIQDSIEVKIIAAEATLGDLTISGPSAVSEHTVNNYSLELFRIGVDPIPGNGETPSNVGVSWSVDTIMPNVTIGNDGALYVGEVPDQTEIIIRAQYVEGFDNVEATFTLTVTEQRPIFGTGPIGIRTSNLINQYLTNTMTDDQTGEVFTSTVPNGEYLYFASPVPLGFVTFIDESNGFEGGMDGATWPDNGSIGPFNGPLNVEIVQSGIGTTWFLYRSDFPGIGTVSYEVRFSTL